MHEGGGNCLNYLKRGWNIKEGRGNKDFKNGGKLGQEVGALKRKGRGAGTRFRTMKRFCVFGMLYRLKLMLPSLTVFGKSI